MIPPGGEIALHHHGSTQVAHVDSGALTYSVESGSVKVWRGPADDEPELVRTISAGQCGRISAGEWLVEQPSDHHRAANRGEKRTVIYLATLLKSGGPALDAGLAAGAARRRPGLLRSLERHSLLRCAKAHGPRLSSRFA